MWALVTAAAPPAAAQEPLWRDFLLSSGFGGLVAGIVAGLGAYFGFRRFQTGRRDAAKRFEIERMDAVQAELRAQERAERVEKRTRWLETATWTWENRLVLGPAATLNVLVALKPKVGSQVHSVLLEVMIGHVSGAAVGGDGP